jgi:hypothetical protein
MDDLPTMKLGLGVYQVMCYGQQSYVRSVKHVLMYVINLLRCSVISIVTIF